MRRMVAAALVTGLAGGAVAGLAGCAPEPADGATVTVFAAASLTDVLTRLAAEFEARHPPVDVVLNFGGSSALAEQVVAGAPADVVATADADSMARLGELALDPQGFATNSLELAVPAGNPGGVTGLADLARPELVVALCDVTVPCGAAAARALSAAGIRPSADTLEQDVRAVLTKLELGEADAGLVYRTDALAAGAGVESIAELARAGTRAMISPIAGAADEAAAFVAFVRSDRGREVLADAGFGPP